MGFADDSHLLDAFFLAQWKALSVLGTGYLACRFGYISEQAVQGLSQYAGKILMPISLFRGMALLPIFGGSDSMHWNLVLCVFLCKLVMFFVAAGAGYVIKGTKSCGGVFGMCLALSNDVGIGIPVLATLFPRIAPPFCFFMVLPAVMIFVPLGHALSGKGGSGIATQVAQLLKQPMMVASAAGVAHNVYTRSGALPAVVDAALEPFAASFICALLFALGANLSLKLRLSSDELVAPAVIILLKLVVTPLVCCRIIAPLLAITNSDDLQLLQLYSALPTAGTVWSVADELGIESVAVGASVAVGTLICGPVMAASNDRLAAAG